MSEIQTISILGCGWYGFALAQDLIKSGFKVKGSSTTSDKADKFKQAGIDFFEINFKSDSQSYTPIFFDCDLLIISIPPKSKTGEAMLFPAKINRVKTALELFKVKYVLFISSTGVYGDFNTEVNEDTESEPQSDSGKNILAAENILKNNSNFDVTILRFGGLIGPGRDPAKFFFGKKNIPNGRAPVNLIHLDNCIKVTKAIIEKKVFGHTFNVCSSKHPSKIEFYTQAALKSGLDAPDFLDELKEWKIVSSKNLVPVLGLNIRDI